MCHPSAEVVGVVQADRSLGPRSKAMPEYFLPYTQQEWPLMTFALRVQGNPASYVELARREVAAVNPLQPIYDVRTMRQRLDESESSARFETFALTSFASLSLVLVVIGLYGILAYRVTQRNREIGLRIALGASRGAIQFAFVREAAALTIIGILAGLGASFALGHFLSSVLFGVGTDDPWTLGGAALLFVLIALAAAWVPARRAAGVDPMRVLRME
jgi:ABC-type antimicrobial peptide transport system permease subunit